jgi:DNA-binding transcriptional ArsR family regulator
MRRRQTERDHAAAEQFAALGSPARLQVMRALVRAGDTGLNVGEIQRHLGLPGSTLAHHLGALARAGLVAQERQGREVISRAAFADLRGLGTYLLEDCCAGLASRGGDKG